MRINSKLTEPIVREKPRILDPRFRYTPSINTDLRTMFARIDPRWNKKPSRRPRSKKESK